MDRIHDEKGFAMITAILVGVVVLSLSLVVVNLTTHNTTSSGFDRDRTIAIAAAEAGLDSYLSALKTDPNLCDFSGDLSNTPVGHYDVAVQLYADWPPTTPMDCPPPSGTLAGGALVTSNGSAVSAATNEVTRTMEMSVRLTPIYGGLGQAVFSDTQLSFQNKMTLNGYQANDGDVYTNGNFSLGNNTIIAGTVYAQGHAFINQGVVKQDVWANSYVDLHSISVQGKATSSTSWIALDNAHLYGDAKAGTTITVSNNSAIDGVQTANSPSGPPPQLPFPRIVYDQKAWVDAGYTPLTYTSCALAKTFINSAPVGDYVLRITPACSLSWSNNSTINLKGNLAIFTDGSVSTTQKTTWNGIAGGPYNLYFIRPYQAGLSCTGSTYNITISNQTSFNNLNILAYTQCTINFGNNNANGFNGQLIGGNVNITNQMVMNYVPLTVPGFNLTGYNGDVSYLREIPNS